MIDHQRIRIGVLIAKGIILGGALIGAAAGITVLEVVDRLCPSRPSN